MAALNQLIERGAELISAAHNVVAMTGAGISTPSGIPDFRSPDSGLWQTIDPLAVASIFAFRQNPDQFYDWIHPLADKLLEASPNPAHHALAAFESQGKLQAVITQNIDDLHGKAGSRNIYELHGSLRELTCIQCYRVHKSTGIIKRFVQDGQTPRCECGGVLKPNVILFGEQLPVREFVAAQMAVKAADLMLVVGSSLETAPASDLPELALENGIKLIIVNYQPTYLDDRADVVLNGNVAEVLPRLMELAVA